jgi:hypothetical protein
VQGGYVSNSQGQQLSVTKKSNVLDKGKPNALNSAAKKLNNHSYDQTNNNSNSNNNTDISDSSVQIKQERAPSPVAAPPPAPEVTVSFFLMT